MTSTLQIAHYLDTLLDTKGIPDYSPALNGLQLANQGEIIRIAAAVDFSTQTITGTIEAGANLMIVHHGMFWSGLQTITGPHYTRLKALIDHNIAVYAAHLPLDKHPVYGNNTLLAHALDLIPSGEFATYKTISIGVRGTTDIETHTLFQKANIFAQSHGGTARSTQIPRNHRTTHWAICTGSGASSDTLREARDLDIDTLIVGEGPHHTAVEAQELGITVIYAGHYATETLGVRALATHLSDEFDIPSTFIEAPTTL